MKRYYIQSALVFPDKTKVQQEIRPLLSVKDMFRKVLITKTAARPWLDRMEFCGLASMIFFWRKNCWICEPPVGQPSSKINKIGVVRSAGTERHPPPYRSRFCS
jgi:hypothetical protein